MVLQIQLPAVTRSGSNQSNDLTLSAWGVVADRPQSVRITFRAGIPRSEQILPRTSPGSDTSRRPSTSNPTSHLFEVTVDKLHLVFIRSMEHLGEIGRTGRFEDRFGQRPPGRGRLWSYIQPRHMFYAASRVLFQNITTTSGVRNLLARFKV